MVDTYVSGIFNYPDIRTVSDDTKKHSRETVLVSTYLDSGSIYNLMTPSSLALVSLHFT